MIKVLLLLLILFGTMFYSVSFLREGYQLSDTHMYLENLNKKLDQQHSKMENIEEKLDKMKKDMDVEVFNEDDKL